MARTALKEYKNLSMAANTKTEPFLIENTFGFAIHVTWTGTPSSKIYVQGSCMSQKPTEDPGQWITLNDAVDTSDAKHLTDKYHLFNSSGAGYRWIRVVSEFTSGTGSLNVIISVKGV